MSAAQQRKPFFGGNWKCNGTRASVKQLVEGLNGAKWGAGVEVVVAPTFVHLDYVLANNVSRTGNGAFTGEVSAEMLRDLGVPWAIVGHSERRTLYGESDAVVAEKTAAALAQGLSVIACIGETLTERKADQTMAVVVRQLAALNTLVKDWGRVVLAYEPVWAIGTGLNATPQQAEEVHAFIRKWLAENVSEAAAAATRIIYGGSVNTGNCDALFAQKNVDGFLVGGASLKAADFIRIAQSHAVAKL